MNNIKIESRDGDKIQPGDLTREHPGHPFRRVVRVERASGGWMGSLHEMQGRDQEVTFEDGKTRRFLAGACSFGVQYEVIKPISEPAPVRMMIQIAGQNDAEKTESLRAGLRAVGHCAEHYEWHQGEPLYHGEPTSGFFEKIGIYCREVDTPDNLEEKIGEACSGGAAF